MIQLRHLGAYEKLAMDGLPYEGMVGKDAADSEILVTDSAAMTSMAGLIGAAPSSR